MVLNEEKTITIHFSIKNKITKPDYQNNYCFWENSGLDPQLETEYDWPKKICE